MSKEKFYIFESGHHKALRKKALKVKSSPDAIRAAGELELNIARAEVELISVRHVAVQTERNVLLKQYLDGKGGQPCDSSELMTKSSS